MRLLNYTTVYFSGILLIIISLWAAIFYFAMLREIYDSIDDGLDNQKGLVIQKAATDTNVLRKNRFDESDYAIRQIPASAATFHKDEYIDTMMFMQNEKSDEPVRLMRTVFLQGEKYYELQVITSMVEEDDLIKQLFYSIVWLYLGLVLSIIVFNNFLLKKIWQPFYNLVKQMKKFRLDKPQVLTMAKTNVDEFSLLNEGVQRFIQRSMETYTSQKHFIENASHELQTPLAISINKLETLAESGDLNPDQFKLLASALDNLEKLARLNKSLLLLFKIENRQFTSESTVNICDLVQQIVNDFSDQSAFNNLSIEIVENEPCVQQMNADLASIMIINLVKNAIIHNQRGGFVKFTINKRSIIVVNSAAGMPLDGEKIFNRFHSDGLPYNSTGLGLAIVKTITDLYHFDICYSFDHKHVITVRFA